MQRNILFSTSSTASMVLHLNKEEQLTLDAIERVIDANNTENMNGLINSLIKYPVDLLQKFYQISTNFKHFCQKNTKFNEMIANSLQNHGYVNVEITSMDGKEHLSLFDIFIAAGNLSQYYVDLPKVRTTKEVKLHCIHAFEIACQLGLYQALTARCDQNTTLFLSPATSSESKEKAIASILDDTKRLSNLYWGMGYVQAGCILQELVEKTASIWKEKGREEIDRMAIFHEESVKNFLCASLLESHPDSKKIEISLTKGKGYIAYMIDRGIKTHTSWSETKIELHSRVNNDDTIYERILNAAKMEIDTILGKVKNGR